jgi:MFS superfamily sulfate permease-like transporter
MINHKYTGEIVRKDALAGTITGLMAIPLSIGICLMSEYPIQTGLLTVVFACIVGFITFLFRPGNYIGVPGVAAGLAPVLAMGVHTFGMENMHFLIFLTSFFQMIVWKNNWERYILKAVPPFLVEGLLAGVGIKIAMKFLPFTYETQSDLIHISAVKAHPTEHFTWEEWIQPERIQVMIISVLVMLLFLYLFRKFKKTSPGLPYVIIIIAGIIIAQFMAVPMLHIEQHDLAFKIPLPSASAFEPIFLLKMIGYALMLATIDVIEQVMSNVAIEKLDEQKRPTNSNNSMLAIWISNMGASLFGGMTNLDGLAKSTTNAIAGAQTKLSNLFTAAVVLFFAIKVDYLEFLPEFSLAVLMVFTGWKMIAGVFHVAAQGQYAFMLSLFCGILVWKLGIFEGLLVALLLHGLIGFFIDRHHNVPVRKIFKKFIAKFVDKPATHHQLPGFNVGSDEVMTGSVIRSDENSATDKKA